MELRQELSPEAQVIVEKVAKAISTFDHATSETLKAAETYLPQHEQEPVIGQMKSTLQIALAVRLCHMTLGHLMPEHDINDCAVNIVQQLQIAANDMRDENGQGPPQAH